MKMDCSIHGVPVGAVLTSRSSMRVVRNCLHSLGSTLTVTPYRYSAGDTTKEFAVHVKNSEVTLLLNDAEVTGVFDKIPPKLSLLLKQGLIHWVNGLRIGSKSCRGCENVVPNTLSWSLSGGERRRRASGLAAKIAYMASCTAVTVVSNMDNQVVNTTTKSVGVLDIEKKSCFRYIELFAGIGGFRIAMDKIGGRCVFASEICREARQTYHANFGPTPITLAGDITEVEASSIPEYDILTGGFPCQSFSHAGEQKGFRDSRGQLFFEVCRLLHHGKPKAFILENVPALVEIDDGAVLCTILTELKNAGYFVKWKILDHKAYVPQRRFRVFFIGVRTDLMKTEKDLESFQWPEGPTCSTPPILRDVLEDFVDESTPKKYKINDIISDRECNLKSTQSHNEKTFDRFKLTKDQWNNIKERNKKRHKNISSDTNNIDLDWRVVDVNGIANTLRGRYRKSWQVQSQFVRVQQKSYNDLNNDSSEVPIRFFTPRECARIQGFPDSFILDACTRNSHGKIKGSHRKRKRKQNIKEEIARVRVANGLNRIYHQIGNSVCPPLVSAIAESLVDILKL